MKIWLQTRVNEKKTNVTFGARAIPMVKKPAADVFNRFSFRTIKNAMIYSSDEIRTIKRSIISLYRLMIKI